MNKNFILIHVEEGVNLSLSHFLLLQVKTEKEIPAIIDQTYLEQDLEATSIHNFIGFRSSFGNNSICPQI